MESASVIPNEIAYGLERELRAAGQNELAEAIPGLRLYAVAVGEGPVGLQVTPSPADRADAIGVRIGDTLVEVSDGRVVYIETEIDMPVRRMLRRMSPQVRS